MKAAVVEGPGQLPRYGDFSEPTPTAEEARVTVHAAALTQLVKGQASGAHYSSKAVFPFVPGADGVGRLDDGRRVYFAFPRAPFGSMAAQTVVAKAFCVDLPDGVDDVAAAAIANPGMSSWAGLERANFQSGQSVLVNGATGASGRLAVQIAKHLGAGRVIATGRTEKSVEPLRALGADGVIALEQEPAKLAARLLEETTKGIDVVLDYLWGSSAEQLIEAFINRGAARVRYVQLGSLGGDSIALRPAVLRSSGLELLGSGLGSVPKEHLVASIGHVLNAMTSARLRVEAAPIALSDVEKTWNRPGSARVVFTM